MEILFYAYAVFVTPAEIPHSHCGERFDGGLVTCGGFGGVRVWKTVAVEVPISHFDEGVDVGLTGGTGPVYQCHIIRFVRPRFIKELEYELSALCLC